LILDNLRVHHSKVVKQWLASHAEQIEVFYLPSYSPRFNPDELLNADLKRRVTTAGSSQNQTRAYPIRCARFAQPEPYRNGPNQ
jgi:transposase